MNYLFRPTPVVVLGRDRGADTVMLSQPPAGLMLGCPGSSGRPSRSLAAQGAPWIVRSGTMASFGTLGQDPSGDLGVDTSGTGGGFDYSGAYASPNLPAPVPPDFPVAPNITDFPMPYNLDPYNSVTWPSPAPPLPSSGTGATGQGIPGTQRVAQDISQGLSLFERIFGASRSAPQRNITLPGVGINPRQQAAPSFWTGSTILPGVPNTTVVLGGAAIGMLLFALLAGGKK